MLSSGMKCYHLEQMLSSGTKCYHLGCNVIIWNEMLSSGMQCYHLELMLSSGTKCYHLELQYCYDMELMLSSGANVFIWYYHVFLSSGMITPPFFIFPENFTHSSAGGGLHSQNCNFLEESFILSSSWNSVYINSNFFMPRTRSEMRTR